MRPGYPRFCDEYRRLLWSLLQDEWSVEEENRRTGHRIRSMRFGAALYVDLSSGRLPLVDVRRTYPRSAAAETAWYVLGTQDPAFIDSYAKRFWDKFKEEDGSVWAAYGYRWRRHFKRDQLEMAIRALREDPSSRRVWVSAWDPAQDGLTAKGQKNVPCPVGFSFSIVGGQLNTTLVMRSSDVFVGLPYDVMGHAMLTSVVRASLGEVDPALGVMTVALAHPHLYDSHYDMAREALSTQGTMPDIGLVEATLDSVAQDPHGFVGVYDSLARTAGGWSTYSPVPEVIE